jgi:predicted CXXCH cytochrome family protein
LARKRGKSAVESGSGKQPAGDTSSIEPGLRSKRRIWIITSVAAVLVASAGLGFLLLNDNRAASKAQEGVATFVGSETCAGCHGAEAKLWNASQHKQAMQHATEKTVLGDFNDASFDYYGLRSRFFRKDGKFLVETDGPDGKLAVFEVKYTFGLDPLQQYLIEFPDGRLQALSLAWDGRPKDRGGQRWFHLYPDEEIKHDDVLHWTRLNQNWNFMCAECHSTGLRKNYDAKTDHFATTWAEISVGCEACHGQGSRHVGWAQIRKSWWPFGKVEDGSKGLLVRFDERHGVSWPIDPRTGTAQRSIAPATLRKEVETCGLCHARRAGFNEDWIPGRWLSDTHVVSPLTRDTYHADGQIRDVEEPYNYAPFKQGRMFAAGVTCSDCHEPHGAKLRSSGDGVCLQCHAPDKYAAVTHHRHATANPPLACLSCHMPARTYMVVDPRHDHSFRVPRPDVSVRLGTPNACNDCHTEKSAQWAAAAIEGWHGSIRKGLQSYAEAFHAAGSDRADSAKLLAEVAANGNTPAIARASALTLLGSRLTSSNINLAQAGLRDADPMVRIAALDMLEGVRTDQAWPLASPLLADPVRGVRVRAASLLAAAQTASLSDADRRQLDRAAAEFVAAQRANAERPEARSALGSFYARRRSFAEAEAEYQAALRLSPQYTIAAINLADLYRQQGREEDSEKLLRATTELAPRDAAVHHALGLALTRLKRPQEALDELRKAAEIEPDQSRYVYVHAVALHSGGRVDDAMAALKGNLTRHPDDRDTLSALVAFSRDAGNVGSALEYAERLARVIPDDRGLAALIVALRRQAGKPAAQ